ncbi:hypothetical protein BT69DRAFT_1280807 [Atractiella rhizophila]|nr:hypothetical protein BT69DRAFT_1280807 [Atractiella rhizophila]
MKRTPSSSARSLSLRPITPTHPHPPGSRRGRRTSNLVSHEFLSTFKNATAIYELTLKYCVVDSFDFRDFIHWFLGDWLVREVAMKAHLGVQLFFGERAVRGGHLLCEDDDGGSTQIARGQAFASPGSKRRIGSGRRHRSILAPNIRRLGQTPESHIPLSCPRLKEVLANREALMKGDSWMDS